MRASTRPARQSKVSYKDPSSSDDEEDEPPGVVPADPRRGQPESRSEVQSDDNDDDKDFTDFDVFAFNKSKDVIERSVVKEEASPSGIKCYTRLRKVQSKTEVIELPRPGRSLRRLTKAGKSKAVDDNSGSDGVEATQARRSLRQSNVKNLKDASSSDEDVEDDGMLWLVFLFEGFAQSLSNFTCEFLSMS